MWSLKKNGKIEKNIEEKITQPSKFKYVMVMQVENGIKFEKKLANWHGVDMKRKKTSIDYSAEWERQRKRMPNIHIRLDIQLARHDNETAMFNKTKIQCNTGKIWTEIIWN